MTERRGRKRGLRATLIHVSAGQIIYHLVQTNGVLDSLSEGEEGGVWGPWGLPATLQPDPHHSCSYLSSSAMSSLLLRHRHQALVTIHRAAHAAAEELPCLHFRALWHFPPDFSLFVSIWSSHLCNTDQAWCRGSQWNLQFMCASCLCVYE